MTDVPSYSLPKLHKRAESVFDFLVDLQCVDRRLTGGDADSIVSFVTSLLPDTHVEEHWEDRADAVRSLLPLLPTGTLQKEALLVFSKAVAGWFDELRDAVPFRAWQLGDKPCWAPFHVLNVERLVRRRRRYRVSMVAIAGRAFNKAVTIEASGAYMQWLIRQCGVPKRESYLDTDLGGMHFTALLSTTRSLREELSDYCFSNSQKRVNVTYSKQRRQPCRLKLFFSNKERTDVARCFDCHLGRGDCYLARHSESYTTLGQCKNGHRGFLVPNGYCHKCVLAGRFKQVDLQRRFKSNTKQKP